MAGERGFSLFPPSISALPYNDGGVLLKLDVDNIYILDGFSMIIDVLYIDCRSQPKVCFHGVVVILRNLRVVVVC